MKAEPHSASQLIQDDVHVNSKDIPFAKSQERFIDRIIWKFSNIFVAEYESITAFQCGGFSRSVWKFLNRLNLSPSMLSVNYDWINNPPP